MDFRTVVDKQSFGVRATGLLVKDEKLLLVKSPEGKYCTLGGAIQVGETTEAAIRREILEEIGIEVEVGPLAFVVENQFELGSQAYHQIEFHYLLTPLSEPSLYMKEGQSIRQCEWVDFSDLEKLDLSPKFLKKELVNWQGQVKQIIDNDSQ
ncbi:NUDIX hydrolase [Streptococcus sp. sy018]|uniref:NUDIX hydrolase n=1 Tax=Streptococcus sp. sy018 TaxID=2600147 RepID=UPI0011B6CCB4|nr:NUDIX domain-containing protein [Streptococcus sp. sy018]TWS94550.1 NUDIX domain-containing protein [Streptococcus sp. sy018]